MNKVINKLAKVINLVTGETKYYINLIPATHAEFYTVLKQGKILETRSNISENKRIAKYQYNMGAN